MTDNALKAEAANLQEPETPAPYYRPDESRRRELAKEWLAVALRSQQDVLPFEATE
jgi:hypothetical protein